MATSSDWGARPIKPQDKDLICPICLNQLIIPRLLTCLHTLCTKCLSSHITNEGTKIRGIHTCHCPVCRTAIRLPFGDTPLAAWAEQFPVDVVLASLLPGNKSIDDRMCKPCSVDGKQVGAKYFCAVCKEDQCQICYAHHQSSKSFKDHQILTLKELMSDTEKAVTVAENLACTNHGNKEYKFFCSDHGKVLCRACLEEEHKGCRNCRKIKVHAKEVIKEQRQHKALNKLKEIEQHLRKVSKIKTQNMLDVEADINQQLSEISTLRQQINSIIDELERRAREESKKIIKEQSMRKLDEDQNIQSLVAAIKNSYKQLEAISKYGSETQVCVVLHKMEDHLLTYQTKAIDYSEILKISIDLNVPDCIREVRMLSVTISPCTVSESRQTIPLLYDLTQFLVSEETAKQLHKHDIHTAAASTSNHNDTDIIHIQRKDKDRVSGRPIKCRDIVKIFQFKIPGPKKGKEVDYTGIACLPDDKIAFLDYANSRCCLYDSCYQYLSEYKFTSHPRRMSIVGTNELAVSLPHEKKIHFLLIGDTITSKRIISTTRWCTAIASLNNNELVFTGYQKHRYHWGVITINGLEISCYFIPRLSETPGGTYLTLNPVQTRVCISCYHDNVVYCFGLDGLKYFEYTNHDLKGPADLAMDMKENLFIVGCDSHNIHQLSQDGSVLQVITDWIPQMPWALCFKNSGEQFLLTTEDEHNMDICFVYQLT